MAQGGATLKILREWNATELATEEIVPPGAAARVLIWDEPGRVDAGPGPEMAAALVSALLKQGSIFFRTPADRPLGERIRKYIHGGQGWRDTGWMITKPATIADALELFEHGWSFGDQIAFIGADARRAECVLTSDDLPNESILPQEAIFAAIVDGAGAVLRASSAQEMQAILENLRISLNDAGIAIDEH